MRIIGLTGGIGSGKSTVAAMLVKLGARIIDADKLAREVVRPGRPAWQEIIDWLGPDILQADSSINRKRLGEIVFADPEARSKLDLIIHPYINTAMRQALIKAESAGEEIVVIDVPLLFETGWDRLVDEKWVVYVDKATQLERLMARDKFTRVEAVARISAQMSLTDKVRLADVVIDNSKDYNSTIKQVETAWQIVNSTAGTAK
jgi:dephospho-CoA kinase